MLPTRGAPIVAGGALRFDWTSGTCRGPILVQSHAVLDRGETPDGLVPDWTAVLVAFEEMDEIAFIESAGCRLLRALSPRSRACEDPVPQRMPRCPDRIVLGGTMIQPFGKKDALRAIFSSDSCESLKTITTLRLHTASTQRGLQSLSYSAMLRPPGSSFATA